MTNFVTVTRGVRQGCLLSPLLFVIGAEILARKIRQSSECRGIKVPQNVEAKVTQFANDTTLVYHDIEALKKNVNILDDFHKISGLKLTKKKTKTLWIGSAKGNKTRPLGFHFPQDPIRTLGSNLSYNHDKNNNFNFFIKIYKMDTKLNMWQARDLTLFEHTMLVKALGISKLVYAAFMLCVPDLVIKTFQEKIFKFLWKNKMDKAKRSVIFQPLSHGGRNFPDFRTQVKSLCLSWLGRLIPSSNEIETWQAIPNEYFNQQGGLAFLLKCNYDTKKLNKRIPLFYCQMLNYVMELRCNY